LLKKYEEKISSKATFIGVALEDIAFYEKEFRAKYTHYLPVFIPYNSVNSKEGKGNYCLYNGNLSVAENEAAVAWLLRNVFDNLTIPLIVAGKNPSQKIARLAHRNSNVRLVANPSGREMQELISEAHVNILPSFNSTGIKIKLINAVFNGRHCVVNAAAVAGSGLEKVCCIAGDSNSFKETIISLFQNSFTEKNILFRAEILSKLYNNEVNARLLIQWIY
jgi:hypothetical protein